MKKQTDKPASQHNHGLHNTRRKKTVYGMEIAGEIEEKDLKEYAKERALVAVYLVESAREESTGYRVIVNTSWKAGNFVLVNFRGYKDAAGGRSAKAREWVSLDRLVQYLDRMGVTNNSITIVRASRKKH